MDAELKQQYDDMGIEPSEEVLDKSLELCVTYHIDDAAEFVEQWVAFSISNLNGAEPTIPHLIEFERKVFQAKRDKEMLAASKKKLNKTTPSAITNLSHLNAMPSSSSANPLSMYGVDDDDVMDDYMQDLQVPIHVADDIDKVPGTPGRSCQTPKAKTALARTPARHNDGIFSPSIGTPRTHTAAPGSGKVVYTFGKQASHAQWSMSLPAPKITVKQLLQHNGESLSAKTQYMLNVLQEQAETASDHLFNIGQALCHKVFGEEAEDYPLAQIDLQTQETVKTIGTVYSDYDGPLDASCTILLGSNETSVHTVKLNFSKAKSVGLFPGQVVMVSGLNPRGGVFLVEDLYTEINLKPPQPPRIADAMSFVIAAGPYTQDDDLVYDPLQDLLAYLGDNKPNVLIMCGPFVEMKHKLIMENTTLTETFEAYFEKMVASIVEAVGTETTILLVASHRDAHSECVYPTMPYVLNQTYPNVHMLPDPSMVDLNGLVIGMTSTDIVNQLLTQELAINAGDKVKRVVNYLLHQKSFFPIFPAKEDTVCFDNDLASKYAALEQVPNILILPSKEKCFLRVVNGCLAINPGLLADQTGGTFARFSIVPPSAKEEDNIYNFVGCQVRKV